MRFSLFMQPVHFPSESPTIAFERDLELIEWWDALGFDEVFIGEHHSSGWELIASPAVFIASAAARTKQIRLGSGVVPLALHQPLYVADEYILLDHLTRGRAILGVGAGGGIPSDPYVVGVERAELQPRFAAAFDAMMRLFENSAPYSLKTGWFELREAVLQVRPYTQPRMPIAVVTGKNPGTLSRIGRHGAIWLTALPPGQISAAWAHVEEGAADAERTADRSQIRLNTIMHLADTREQAFEDVRAAAAREQFDFAVPILGRPQPEVAREDWIDVMAEAPTVIIGTPDDAIVKIRAIEKASGGVGGLLIMSKEWASLEATRHSYELTARYVFPEFQGALEGVHAAEQVARGVD
jgi:limonene 1,2-monooxygenase